MADFTPTPIEPGAAPSPAVARFLDEWQNLQLGTRVMAAIYLLIGGAGAIVSSYALTSDIHRWWAWLISLTILEPIAAVAFLALTVLVAPRSFASQLLEGALRRARVVAIAFLIAYLTLIVGLFAFVGWEAWRSR